MTREQTKKCLEAMVRACYYGATKRTRLIWCLCQTGVSLSDARQIIKLAGEARIIEFSRADTWVAATPFLCGIVADFDNLAADVKEWL